MNCTLNTEQIHSALDVLGEIRDQLGGIHRRLASIEDSSLTAAPEKPPAFDRKTMRCAFCRYFVLAPQDIEPPASTDGTCRRNAPTGRRRSFFPGVNVYDGCAEFVSSEDPR